MRCGRIARTLGGAIVLRALRSHDLLCVAHIAPRISPMQIALTNAPHWLAQFSTWLQSTPLSLLLQNVEWIVPLVQTVHILAIGAVIASVFIVNLRLLGLIGNDESPSRVGARFLPVIWYTLPVLIATGVILIIAEPARSLGSIAFQLKMLLFACAVIITLYHHRSVLQAASRADQAGGHGAAKFVAILSLLLWSAIIFAGRWIAYAPGK